MDPERSKNLFFDAYENVLVVCYLYVVTRFTHVCVGNYPEQTVSKIMFIKYIELLLNRYTTMRNGPGYTARTILSYKPFHRTNV